jgi:hypothetical protein
MSRRRRGAIAGFAAISKGKRSPGRAAAHTPAVKLLDTISLRHRRRQHQKSPLLPAHRSIPGGPVATEQVEKRYGHHSRDWPRQAAEALAG